MRWSELFIVFCFLLSAVSSSFAAGDPQDCAGCSDPPMFSRMPGFFIYNAQELEFDRCEFTVADNKKETVEGQHRIVTYYAKEGSKLPSGLQIAKNYSNAAAAIGGQMVFQYDDGGILYTTLRIPLANTEVWAEVSGGGNGMYTIKLVEKQAMRQVVKADAASMSSSLGVTGRVAIYDIYFDTDKAEVKKESAPALVQIAKLLQTDPTLKVYIVGHTDNTGNFDHNLRLSQARAVSVVTALVKDHHIAASRLQAFGAGPTAPVTVNDNEANRAKNRRVELVQQ